MTQTIINVPAAFDPTDITLTDDTSGALLIKEGSNEYMRIDTTNGSEQMVLKGRPGSAANAGLFLTNQPYLQGPVGNYIQFTGSQIVLNQGSATSTRHILGSASSANTWLIRNSGSQDIVKVDGAMQTRIRAQSFIVSDKNSDTPMFEMDNSTNATFTLDGGSGAVFKVVDDAASPRTYFTATENGTVHVDGVKVGRGGGAIVDNVAIGDGAFDATQTSLGNSVAVGYDAGNRQTSGWNSTFVGQGAGKGITTGLNNTALGNGSIDGGNGAVSCTGNGNTGVGRASVRFCETGNDNSGFGHEALENVSSGSDNVGLGALAGDSITTGSGNIAIGHDSDCAAAGVNQIAIGNGVVETTNNRASIGDSSNVATLDFSSAGNSWSTTSDVRIKENIQDSDLGLAFINSLRPVKHTSKDPTQWPEEIRMADPSGRTPEQLEAVKDGLIAQEVKAAADALGTTFSGWEQDANGLNRLQYERFVVPLIKAVQELSAQVEELKGDK